MFDQVEHVLTMANLELQPSSLFTPHSNMYLFNGVMAGFLKNVKGNKVCAVPKYCDGFSWHCGKKIFVRAYTRPKLLPESFGYTIIIDNFMVLLIMSITSWFNRDLFYHGQFFSTVYEFYDPTWRNPKFAQGYIFLQIPCFLGRETIQPKLKLGKKLRREQ